MPGRRRTVVNYDEYIATARLAEDTPQRAARTLNEIPNWQVGNYQYDAQIAEVPADAPPGWRTVTDINAIVPNNVVDPAAYANVVYRFDDAVYFAVAGAPVRCHKEPQATTPKGEFEMDAD